MECPWKAVEEWEGSCILLLNYQVRNKINRLGGFFSFILWFIGFQKVSHKHESAFTSDLLCKRHSDILTVLKDVKSCASHLSYTNVPEFTRAQRRALQGSKFRFEGSFRLARKRKRFEIFRKYFGMFQKHFKSDK